MMATPAPGYLWPLCVYTPRVVQAGGTALMWAIDKKNDAMANALLARTANVDLQDDVSQDSAECGYGVVVMV